MDLWHPRGIRAKANLPGLDMLAVAPKVVLHTTESSSPYTYDPNSYYGNPYWPHATIDQAGIHQHLPINVGGYALYHESGRAETNRANAIQCEIVWFAGNAADMPDALLANVADWVRWVCGQTGAPLAACPQGFHGQGEGMVLASPDSPIRFSDADWLASSGVCGHQHVPSGNDHWDPGAFPWDRMLAMVSGQEDFLAALTDDEQREVLEILRGERDRTTFANQVLTELKTELEQAAGTDNWFQVGEGLKDELAGKVAANLDYDRLATTVADKLAARLAQ